jgi:Na+-transporting NADH:ubiquinone oxidoreductase subunit NqrE
MVAGVGVRSLSIIFLLCHNFLWRYVLREDFLVNIVLLSWMELVVNAVVLALGEGGVVFHD